MRQSPHALYYRILPLKEESGTYDLTKARSTDILLESDEER